jgi:hypothetical protein
MDSKGLEQPALDPIQLGVALGPTAVKAGLGASKLIGSGAKAVGQGVVKGFKVAFAPTVQNAEKAISRAEGAKGLTTVAKSFPRGGKGLETFLNQAKDISGSPQALSELGPQGVKNLRQQISGVLNAGEPQRVFGIKTGPSPIGNENYAIAAQAKAATTKALNEMVDGREAAAQDLANAILRAKIVKKGLKAGGAAIGIGGIAGLGGN